MRTMNRAALVSAGVGLGVVGGFLCGLLRERRALSRSCRGE